MEDHAGGFAFDRDRRICAQIERRFVAARLVLERAIGGGAAAQFGFAWIADARAEAFAFFIHVVVYRYNGNGRHFVRSGARRNADADAGQGFGQGDVVRYTGCVGVGDALDIIRFQFAQVQFEQDGAFVFARAALRHVEDHAGGFAFDRDRRICRDIDEWLWRNVDV